MVYLVPIVIVAIYFGLADTDLIGNILDRINSTGSEDQSLLDRLNAQSRAIDAFLESPITGAFYLDPVRWAFSAHLSWLP
jgi:O-antigen ligase